MFDIVKRPKRDVDIFRWLTCTNTVYKCDLSKRNLSTDRKTNNLLIHKTNKECAPMNRQKGSDVLNREVFDYFRSLLNKLDNLMDGMHVESVVLHWLEEFQSLSIDDEDSFETKSIDDDDFRD